MLRTITTGTCKLFIFQAIRNGAVSLLFTLVLAVLGRQRKKQVGTADNLISPN